MSATIVWFRRDLRLADNPALAAALRTGLPVIALYVHAPDEEAPWSPGAASRWWLHHSLLALRDGLRAAGTELTICRGPSARALADVRTRTGASHVFWNRLYEPAALARDARIETALRNDGTQVESFNASLLFEPCEIATGSGGPYRVFTPFWRNARARLAVGAVAAAPRRIPAVANLATLGIEELGLLPRIGWDAGMRQAWGPGEAGALAVLRRFLDGALPAYASARDRPDVAGTSRLSPHLHFGEISPRQVVLAMARRGLLERGEKFLGELGWREFSHHLLFHFPHTAQAPMNAQFARFPWARRNPRLLRAWQEGRTGIPIVDAGMRELWTTGWMHNRVRMVVASLLTKNLRQHWLSGARWFWDTLVDADLANNTQGWQWTAGSGADAAPYFRIFNPVTQGSRFDPDGAYVRRWIPELARVPAAAIHTPWTLRPVERRDCGIDGTPYAKPLIDLKSTREAALAAYQQMRASV